MNDSISNTTSRWQKLYFDVWQLVQATFFDVSRLKDWDKLAHAYDDEIVDEASALACVDRLLATLNDTYSERIVPARLSLAAAPPADGSESEKPAQEKHEDVLAVVTGDNLGYLRVLSFDREDIADRVEEAAQKLADCRGIVLDLRQNGGGRMHQAMECCSLFLENALISTLKFRNRDGQSTWQYFVNSDQFFAEVTERDSEGNVLAVHNEMYKRRPAILAGKPLVLLINSRTASAGELTVCSLVQYGEVGKVLMVGSGCTPGKGIGQGEYEVPDSDVRIRITRIHWFAPGGEWLGDCGQTTASGIEPEVLVEGDRGPEGLKAAVDELRKMLERLAGQTQVQDPAA
ncbi:MAG: hypothetical protein HY986_04740 [Candidatus Melainabacteria bacterium]|nr:hypothetical protein [Candidatus Melainabacteria bacterium]